VGFAPEVYTKRFSLGTAKIPRLREFYAMEPGSIIVSTGFSRRNITHQFPAARFSVLLWGTYFHLKTHWTELSGDHCRLGSAGFNRG
jgi:hypothetical protein